VAPLRKEDPGELFDWRRLAAAGIGLWPAAGRAAVPDDGGPSLQAALAAFGYCVEATGVYDAATRAAVTALQRHWRPARIDGVADAETRARLAALLDRAGASA
jgi:N-acetylmuramoyl-L-alanine amidase